MAVKIVECYSISPCEGAALKLSLPLLYLDMIWFQFPPTHTLRFYALECSHSRFLETIVVQLKHSLSIALKHFLPLASKIIFPLTSPAMPVSRYATGDSVALTVAISDADFFNMTANHCKEADEFHSLVPRMPGAVCSSDEIKLSAIAIQVTLFPDQGICIGFTHHHAVCDATTLFGFFHTWASINKSGGDECNLVRDFLPFYRRNHVQDAARLGALGWDQIKTSRPNVPSTLALPLGNVRATFVLSDAEIERLKKNHLVGRASTFVVVCAHLWSCLAKSADVDVDNNEPEYLTSPVDCRARLNPRLPSNYFGNCLMLLRVASTHGRLKGSEGFAAAVEAIVAAIRSINTTKGRVVSDYYENRSPILSGLMGKRVVTVVGSSSIDHYAADYGWGRGVKYECIHTDFNGGVNLCKARNGGVEISLSMPKAKMETFAAVFNKHLYINTSNL